MSYQVQRVLDSCPKIISIRKLINLPDLFMFMVDGVFCQNGVLGDIRQANAVLKSLADASALGKHQRLT